MNDPTNRSAGTDGADERKRLIADTMSRYAQTRERLDASAAGHVQRRITELELMNQALILAALALMLFIPALISLAAVAPIGSDSGLAAHWARHLALSTEASHDVRGLFASKETISNATTPLSAVITFLFAVGWPATLQHGYEIMWGLPSRGARDLWRAVVWLITFIALIAVVAASSSIAGGVGGAVVTGLICSPLVFGWAWWMQHFLLGGRIGWRALLGGAVSLTIALFGLSVFMAIFLSGSITGRSHQYGPIGVVFALLSWFIAIAVVMLGGALVGATLYQRRSIDNQVYPGSPAPTGPTMFGPTVSGPAKSAKSAKSATSAKDGPDPGSGNPR
ncbi:hypothetical protein [Frankia sp. Cr2]|uniref:hypothetical protein n=1 Tax=Frankia sp. Cr2 TaxID=3073932 RepID=UPI002AD401D8|nr:hypothetical protein [Frankia sp. Cr2]